MGERFTISRSTARKLVGGRGTRAKLEELVDDVAATYRENVPIDTGDLFDSIYGEVIETEDGPVGRVGADDWKAHFFEHGTIDLPPQRPLGRALEANGLDPGRKTR